MNRLQAALLSLLTICLLAPFAYSQRSGPMTNADVIEMVKAGLSDQIVTNAVRQAPSKNFDLTAAGLIALKKAGVSDNLIQVLQESSTAAKPAMPAETQKVPAGPSPEAASAPFRYKVSAESGGALEVRDFVKINGYERKPDGFYIVEFYADVAFLKNIYKTSNGEFSYWQNFRVLFQKPAENPYEIGGSARYFPQGTVLRIAGTLALRPTEQGWRAEEYKAGSAQVISSGTPNQTSPPTGASQAVPAAKPKSLSSMLAELERGDTLSFPVRYYSASAVRLNELPQGILTLSKRLISFEPTADLKPFSVAPEKVLLISDRPKKGSVLDWRMFLKVAVKAKDGVKEKIEDFEFFDPRTVMAGNATLFSGAPIECTGCDASIRNMMELIQYACLASPIPPLAVSKKNGAGNGDQPATAAALVARVIEAAGGRSALENTRDLYLSETLIDNAGQRLDIEEFWSAPNKYRQSQTVNLEKIEYAFDGTDSWTISKGKAKRMEGSSVNLRIVSKLTGPVLYVNLAAPGTDVEFLGPANVRGRNTFKIKVKDKDLDSYEVYFDSSTYLPVKIAYEATFNGVATLMEYQVVEHLEHEGLKLIRRVVGYRGGVFHYQMIVTGIKLNAGLSPDLWVFDKAKQ